MACASSIDGFRPFTVLNHIGHRIKT
jgi:hypothetical protein